MVEEDPVVLQISGLGQGTGQLSTQKVILQSEGHVCHWRSGTLANGQALKFLVAHPCSEYEPVLGIGDLLSAVLRLQGSSKQPHPAF